LPKENVSFKVGKVILPLQGCTGVLKYWKIRPNSGGGGGVSLCYLGETMEQGKKKGRKKEGKD
jgi:hypothetical protein